SQTREQIRESLTTISQRCQPDADGQKRVVFYGAGDVAEIAYVSLQSTDLTLVGVVDDRRRGRFFDVEICAPECLDPETLDGKPYAHVVVASVRQHVTDAIQKRISDRG